MPRPASIEEAGQRSNLSLSTRMRGAMNAPSRRRCDVIEVEQTMKEVTDPLQATDPMERNKSESLEAEPAAANVDASADADGGVDRREFLGAAFAAGVPLFAPRMMDPREVPANEPAAPGESAVRGASTETVSVSLTVNRQTRRISVDARTTLLDTLRNHLGLTGTKKGCNHGECGACTVHVDGRRVLSCLTLAVTAQGKAVTTVEGLQDGDRLHPMQQAFIDQDALQCGYCTPGQIMSAVACVREGHARSPDEIREYMSGNICRCSAYPQIVSAIRQAAASTTSGGA
jgi:xanthine dehydrogenase YagT iron-sulfur-binding subunit